MARTFIPASPMVDARCHHYLRSHRSSIYFIWLYNENLRAGSLRCAHWCDAEMRHSGQIRRKTANWGRRSTESSDRKARHEGLSTPPAAQSNNSYMAV